MIGWILTLAGASILVFALFSVYRFVKVRQTNKLLAPAVWDANIHTQTQTESMFTEQDPVLDQFKDQLKKNTDALLPSTLLLESHGFIRGQMFEFCQEYRALSMETLEQTLYAKGMSALFMGFEDEDSYPPLGLRMIVDGNMCVLPRAAHVYLEQYDDTLMRVKRLEKLFEDVD